MNPLKILGDNGETIQFFHDSHTNISSGTLNVIFFSNNSSIENRKKKILMIISAIVVARSSHHPVVLVGAKGVR
jgi:hypothetical protein